jgi:acyl-CoA thioesterase
MHADAADAQDLAERSARAMWDADQASRGLGMALVSVAPGEAVMTMTVGDAMVNGHGICHGGYMFLLADSTFAYACNSRNERTVAAHADISFLRAARLGDVLTARGREVWREGRNGIYDMVVTDHNGQTVALFRGRSRTIGGPVIGG